MPKGRLRVQVGMPTYLPNFDNKQVRARVIKVLKFVAGIRGTRTLHHDVLAQHFGQPTHNLARYLQALLLRRVSGYDVGVKAYSYEIKPEGVKFLEDKLKIQAPTYVEAMTERHAAELSTLSFTYKDTDSRLYHPLQNLKKQDKRTFWASYLPYDYDIETAAPTLLFQQALKIGALPLLLLPIADYLADIKGWRAHVTVLVDGDEKLAKTIITSLFNGARLAQSHRCSLFVAMEEDILMMQRLQDDGRLARLQTAIKYMWTVLKRHDTKNWHIYFKIERACLDAWVSYLNERQIKHFCEHDGVRTAVPLDTAEVTAYIKRQAGYQVTIIQKG